MTSRGLRRLTYRAVVTGLGEGALFRELKAYRDWSTWTSEEVLVAQSRLLLSTLRHAGETTCWYPAVRNEEATSAPALIASYPLLTKTDLQDHGSELLSSRRSNRTTVKVTGGSTGQAVTVVKNRGATARERAAMWYGYSWNGVEIADRVARFWGAPFATRNRLVTALGDVVMNRVRFSAFAFDQNDLRRYWRTCSTFRPRYFHGYVSMLDAFARFLEEHGYDGRVLALKSIVATSEALTTPQRDLMERVFGAPVQGEYGCGEVGPIAYECDKHRLHVMARNVYVEVIGEDGLPAEDGVPGRVIVTDLANRAMPVIRYDIGDLAVRGSACACGRPFPTLDRVWGRAYDFVVAPGGARYHGEFVMYIFEDLRRLGWAIRQFKVIQETRSRLHVLVVPGKDDGVEAMLAEVAKRVREAFSGMEVFVDVVASIPRSPSGKMAVIESRLPREQ